MKRKHGFLILLTTIGLSLTLASCNSLLPSKVDSTSVEGVVETIDSTDYSSLDVSIDTEVFESSSEVTNDFSITTEVVDGYTVSNNVYTITKGGVYTLKGQLTGQIVIEAPDQEVELDLDGVSITCSSNSPLYVSDASEVKIKALGDTYNTITDSRSAKTVDSDTQGEGAIYSKADLKLVGKGTLVVEGNYNNGVHTTKDLSIKNIALKSTGYNNSIKGKDSIEITSGTILAISKTGDGLKTESTDVSSKGNQRGNIDITGGEIAIYSADDALDAAYNVNIANSEETIPTLEIVTGSYSSYTTGATDGSKGIVAQNAINIEGGKIDIKSEDHGISASYGTTLDNSSVGLGNVNISGGETTIYAKSTSSASSYRGGQSSSTGGKGVKAEGTLTVSGGTLNVTNSYEGLEAQHMIIAGGNTIVYATDDGINVSNKSSGVSLGIDVTGGSLDITVGSGDVDGIDSNGYYTQTGGTVITRGAPGSASTMASGLDVDGKVTISGGTLIGIGTLESTPSTSSSVHSLTYGSTQSGGMGGFAPGGRGSSSTSSSSSVSLTAGTWTLSLDNETVSFTLTSTYSACTVYSSLLTSGSTYTLSSTSSSYSATAK